METACTRTDRGQVEANGVRMVRRGPSGPSKTAIGGVVSLHPDFLRGTEPQEHTAHVGACRDNAGSGAGLLNSSGLYVKGTLVSSSDRNQKQGFAAINSREILERVAALPLTTWTFKQDAGTRYLGPMAQDFHEAFALEPDDKHIAMVDADGVALAAIQGLNEKVESGIHHAEGRIKKLEAENTALKERLAKLEQLVLKLTAKGN